MKKIKHIICALCLFTGMIACVDNDDVVTNYYVSTKVTASGFLDNDPERFS